MYNDWPYSFTLELIIGAKKHQDNRGFARKWKESEKEIVTMDMSSNKKLAHSRDKIFSNLHLNT